MRCSRYIGASAAGVVACVVGVTLLAASSGATTSAKSEYLAALEAAGAQSVHFVSRATEPGSLLEVIGDSGKTSGSQAIEVRRGAMAETLTVVLVGSTGYVKGNAAALLHLLGLTAGQSASYSNRWLSFPTSLTALTELVSPLRDSEVASELEMSGPYTFGGTKMIGGHEAQAIDGTAATSSGTKIPIVLYVDAVGTPRPVEQVTNPTARSGAIKGTITFADWGEKTDPRAPSNSVSLMPLIPAG